MNTNRFEKKVKRLKLRGMSFADIASKLNEPVDKVRYWGTFKDPSYKQGRAWVKTVDDNNTGVLTEEELFSSMCY